MARTAVHTTKKKRSTPASANSAPPIAEARIPDDLFTKLGLHGLAPVAPVLLAALVTEEPLLLIGPHGTAKTLLLTRIAAALGLSARHYNASLLNFDDLVGFPLPGKDGTLEYIKTPAAIWGAGAVIFDEISRCRPDVQNKLFPIIHERKVQGLPLVDLRYRWSAMNPPGTDDSDNGYTGSEPLDAALADRFAFILAMPSWDTLNEPQQLAVIRAIDAPVDAHAAQTLTATIGAVRSTLASLDDHAITRVASYVRSVSALLAQAGITLSPRRRGMIHRTVLAVQASAAVIEPSLDPAECTLLALRASLPQRAQGVDIAENALLAAHRQAWRLHAIDPLDPLRVILLTADPLERFRLAIRTPALSSANFSTVVADCLAQVAPSTRAACILYLFEQGCAGRLNAAIADQTAVIYKGIIEDQTFSDIVHGHSHRYTTWTRITELLATLDPESEDDRRHANAVVAGFQAKDIATPADAETYFGNFRRVRDLLQGVV
jgi:MoxR-like ATPase